VRLDDAMADNSAMSWPPIVELRQYTLHPGKRDVLIDLFDRELIESQEALGMMVLGQFRDVDDSDRFVWLRGFRDMPARAEGLRAFYGGPVWQRHREVANAMMIDSDNVLLLSPAGPETGFLPPMQPRPPAGTGGDGIGLVIATVYSLQAPAGNDVVDHLSRMVKPALIAAGATALAFFVTDGRPNNFPTLPVRENENVLVWLVGFAEATTALGWSADHSALEPWGADASNLKAAPQRLRLTPTARSSLSGASQGWSD
jgi:hypothetical protein